MNDGTDSGTLFPDMSAVDNKIQTPMLVKLLTIISSYATLTAAYASDINPSIFLLLSSTQPSQIIRSIGTNFGPILSPMFISFSLTPSI
jgi:hypothetical protein